MCGIFGYVSDKPIGENLRSLKEIGELNKKRGNQSFGYVAVDDQSYIIGRYNWEFSKEYALSVLKDYKIVLFHLLSSTGTEKRIHPFETDQFVFAHNGLLLDYQDQKDYSRLGPTDSQYLLAAIDSFENEYSVPVSNVPVAISIKLANERFNGQRACWLWDKFDNALYLWRVMSPLYLSIYADSIVFSSVRIAEGYHNIQEGSIYKIKDMQLKEVAKFDFYNPYYQGENM